MLLNPSSTGRRCIGSQFAPFSSSFRPRCHPLRCRHRQPASHAPVSTAAASSSSSGHYKVLLTREAGKNDKMRTALTALDLECIELPLIEHTPGPDRDRLPERLGRADFDWVTVTSPEAATVFLEGWTQAGKPKVRIAVVGGGTGEILQVAGVTPDFQASKATGKTLGGELPQVPGGTGRVLYPASVKAPDELANSLNASGFTVERLNTYDTGPAQGLSAEAVQLASSVNIVTFGSPSAVKAWIKLVGLPQAQRIISVCIGATSARACENAGLTQVFYPDSPGIEGWVESVNIAVGLLEEERLTPVPVAAA